MIRIELVKCDGDIEVEVTPGVGGKVISGLKRTCPFCDQSGCYYDCDESTADFEDEDNSHHQLVEDEEQLGERRDFNCAIQGIESMILNCAINSVDITTEEFQKSIQDSVEQLKARYLTLTDAN